jgi:hypothetical protein
MNKRTRIVAGTLMTIGVALAGTALAEGTAQALPGGPMPLSSWPGCPPDSPEGPCRWCPGDPPVQTGNLRINATPTGTSTTGRATSRRTSSKETHPRRRLRRRRT